jgi:hypothetical protein
MAGDGGEGMMGMRTTSRSLAVLVGAVLVTVAVGCTTPVSGPVAPPESGGSVTPTEPPKAGAVLPEVAASGSVVSPKQGDAIRTALMDAARVKLGTSSQFYVLALKTDGAWAIAALRTVDGGKGSWVALRNEVPGGWVAIWSAGDGSGAAEAIALADPRFAPAVLSAMDFTLDVGKPTVAEAEAAVLKLAKKAYAEIPIKSAKVVGMGVDSKGDWWVQAWTDAGTAYEGEQWFAYWDGSVWKIKDYGTGLDRVDLPSDIKWKDVP